MDDDTGPAAGPTVLVVGEALVDVVRRPGQPDEEHPGGSAANVAVALARLGRRVRFASAWADDARGEALAEHLRRDGVVLASDPHVLGRTSTAVATLGGDGAAEYAFDLDWRLGPVDAGTGAPQVVHVCSIGAVLPPGADDVRALVERLRPSALVTYDVNARPSITGAGPRVVERVEALAALADVVKASDEDLETLWPGRAEADTVAALLAAGVRAVVVTRGGDGVSVVTPAGEDRVTVAAVRVADTIGAGDTLMAGVVEGLVAAGIDARTGRGGRLEDVALWGEVLRRAAAMAAVTVSRPGADPPYRRELPA